LRKVARRAFRSGPEAGLGSGAWFSREETVMGTAIRVELWCRERDEAVPAMAAVMDEMHRIDREMSPHKPESELSRINRNAGREAVRVSPEMYGLLERALEFSRLSEGAFDITYASVGHLYDYRERVRPDAAALARAREAIGYTKLHLDPAALTLRFDHPGTKIDLGGFAKGHAVENCAAILRGRGIEHAIVTAGGDSRILGDRGDRPWTVGVRDPRRPGALAAVLPLADVAVSTSGDYERYFDEEGVRFHHILDPRTGASPSGVRSVTIVAPDGLTSEGLSKSVFVLGLERGMRLVDAQRDVDAVVIDAQGRLHYSRGLRAAGSDATRPAAPLRREPRPFPLQVAPSVSPSVPSPASGPSSAPSSVLKVNA
jgi:thiamine biosynthesis lipoprotein